MTGCSSDELLVRLLDDQIDGDDYDSIVAHIETCQRCQQRLESFTKEQAESSGLPSRLGDSMNRRLESADPTSESAFAGSGSVTLPLSYPDSAAARTIRRSEADFPDLPEYEILAELGHGGMGIVYKARHRSLNRLVALKMIRAGSMAKPEDLARFRVEAEAVAKLRHPNIIQIYDIGEHDGLPFVALELLEGGSLGDVLGGTPQMGERSAATVATLARAVHAAHEAGIIHRDLKPSNVLFASKDTPKVTDFGLAKRLEESGQTETGQVLGSPSYIPPEQARGQSKDVGPPADVYALGAILYETLTGRPPFKGTTPVDTVMQVLHDEPLPPSRLSPQVPRDLETICLKCLAKEPHRRYPTARALAEDLDRYLSNQPIRARRTPPWELGLKWARRRPTFSTLGAVGFLVAAIVVFTVWRSHAAHTAQLHKITQDAELSLTKAGVLLDVDSPVEDLSRLTESLSWWVTTLEREPELAEERSRAVKLLTQARGRRAEHDARNAFRDHYRDFQERADNALFSDSQFTGLGSVENVRLIRDLASKALEVFAVDGTAGDRWQLATLPASLTAQERENVLLGCYEMLLVYAEAVSQPLTDETKASQARAALEILERARDVCPRPSRAYHLRRADYLERSGDTTTAGLARAEADTIKAEDAFDHFLLGLAEYKRGFLKAAIHHFSEALFAQPGHFWAQCYLANCELNLRPPRADEARTRLTACLKSHPEAAWLYLLRGFASSVLGADSPSAAEKESHFQDAEADYRDALRRDPSGRFRYARLANRGLLRIHSGRLDEALADLEEAIALNPREMSAYVTMAQIRRQEHKFDEALELLGRAIALKPDTAGLYRLRARWNLDHPGPKTEARARARADLSAAISRDIPGSRDLAEDLVERARLSLLDKQDQPALDDCDAALGIMPENTDALRYRVSALLELNRFQDAISSCDACLRAGQKSPELVSLRGLGKARLNDFAGAIDDYTLALAAQPGSPTHRARRGWAYLKSGAPQLARRDFDEVIRLDTCSADGYCGRASALLDLGLYRDAVGDAEQALRRATRDARLSYSAARILAQAATAAQKQPRPRSQLEPADVTRYQERAVALLGDALEHTPPDRRDSFWRDYVRGDQALTAIRRLPGFARLAGQYGVSQP
jgi:serine/threonine protein kinase/tetratricopeptide (TPR) repeat protein